MGAGSRGWSGQEREGLGVDLRELTELTWKLTEPKSTWKLTFKVNLEIDFGWWVQDPGAGVDKSGKAWALRDFLGQELFAVVRPAPQPAWWNFIISQLVDLL